MSPHRKQISPGSPEDWLTHAKSDLKIAKIAKEKEDIEILDEQICFHAQQAAEKALKSILLFYGIPFPFIHDLTTLVRLIRDNNISMPEELRDVTSLTPYAVEARYPGYLGEITTNDVDEAIDIAKAAITWAESIILTPPNQ
jgi:HEPN domain-containing protein